MRLFLAIPLPPEITERIETICRGLPDVRWVPAEQMHITLRFLGDDLTEAHLEDVIETLNDVVCDSFDLQLGGVGRFLHPRAPQVLWLGVNEQPALLELHRRIESRLRVLGYAGEKRAYTPHITLARLKGVSDHRVLQYLELYDGFVAGSCSVTEFVLFSSVLRPGGAQHTCEAVFPLVSYSIP